MKIKYILATSSDISDTLDNSNYKIWLPVNNGIFHLDIHNVIYAIRGTTSNLITRCDMLCDVNTHEQCIEIAQLGAHNPLELMMKLELYPNLYLEII